MVGALGGPGNVSSTRQRPSSPRARYPYPPRITSLSPGGRNMAPSAIRSRKRPGEKGHRCEGVMSGAGTSVDLESTGTPVPLQCHPEVVWPDGHAELLG